MKAMRCDLRLEAVEQKKEPNEVVIRLLTVFAALSRRTVCGLIDAAQSDQRLVAQKR